MVALHCGDGSLSQRPPNLLFVVNHSAFFVSHRLPLADRLVPDVVTAFAAGREVELRNPAAVRPWQHVLEPLAGYLTLAERLYDEPSAFAEGWNFGPSEEDARPVSWVASRIGEAWGSSASWHLSETPHPHEANFLKLDCS